MELIKNWLITGDTHGRVADRLKQAFNTYPYPPEETAVIILGDAGLNYYLGKRDTYEKQRVAKTGYTIYCLRGNHEERPSLLGFPQMYDENVKGEVYYEEEFPTIRYFSDCGGEYNIGGFDCLTVPGAYSVDKFYRLQNNWKWFPFEQLSEVERKSLEGTTFGRHYDIVMSHTCPISWEPTDLFLSVIDQSTVDKSMEIWLDYLKDNITWSHWCFGHYHADRLERPMVLQMFEEIYTLDDMISMMYNSKYNPKSPGYFMGV